MARFGVSFAFPQPFAHGKRYRTATPFRGTDANRRERLRRLHKLGVLLVRADPPEPSRSADLRTQRRPSTNSPGPHVSHVWVYVTVRDCGTAWMSGGPGRTRTCASRIGSPAWRAATSCERWKCAATRTNRGCNELQQDAADGDKLYAHPHAHLASAQATYLVGSGARPSLGLARL